MSSKALAPLHGGEFDRFLFASVGDERNGMSLSVLSALARLGVDPWEETLALSRLPRPSATARLAGLIASTTRALAGEVSTETVAARLVALLPNPPAFVARAPGAAIVIPSVRPSWLMVALALLAVVVGACAFYVSQRSGETVAAPSVTTTEAPRR